MYRLAYTYFGFSCTDKHRKKRKMHRNTLYQVNKLLVLIENMTRKLCYCKDDRAMRAI